MGTYMDALFIGIKAHGHLYGCAVHWNKGPWALVWVRCSFDDFFCVPGNI